MISYDLSKGSFRLTRAMEKRYPDLEHREVESLCNIMLEEIGTRIDAGEQLAFLKTRSDGKYELTTLGLEILEKVRYG